MKSYAKQITPNVKLLRFLDVTSPASAASFAATWASVGVATRFLEPIDHTDMKVQITLQAGAKAVDQSDGALGLPIEPCAKALFPNRLSKIL